MTLLTPEAFERFCLFMVLGACLWFFCLDVYRLGKALREPAGPLVRDRIFGAGMGLVCAVVGALGIYLQFR